MIDSKYFLLTLSFLSVYAFSIQEAQVIRSLDTLATAITSGDNGKLSADIRDLQQNSFRLFCDQWRFNGEPLLHHAALQRNSAAMRKLLRKGLSVNSQTGQSKFTPMHCCVKSGFFTGIKLLHEHKADAGMAIDIENSLYTPIGYAMLRDIKLARRMVKLGIKPYITDLISLAKKKFRVFVEFFEACEKSCVWDFERSKLLCSCIDSSNINRTKRKVEYLLANGFSFDDCSYRNVLRPAADSYELTLWLLQLGADASNVNPCISTDSKVKQLLLDNNPKFLLVRQINEAKKLLESGSGWVGGQISAMFTPDIYSSMLRLPKAYEIKSVDTVKAEIDSLLSQSRNAIEAKEKLINYFNEKLKVSAFTEHLS